MSIFLDRIDSAPLEADDFSFEMNSWISNLVDSQNENLVDIENAFNFFVVQSLTQAEIITDSATAPDGSIWYCTDHVPPCFVGKADGVLVQFLTAAFP
jgi:hypothetical protein